MVNINLLYLLDTIFFFCIMSAVTMTTTSDTLILNAGGGVTSAHTSLCCCLVTPRLFSDRCNMPKGIYIRTKGFWWKGKCHTEETKRKISASKKGDTSKRRDKSQTKRRTKGQKTDVREKGHCICQCCGKTQLGVALAVHHIDHDKLNCEHENLIALCMRCHRKLHLDNP